ncbi:MAG: pyridoxal phosphate-dependent aminotransferase [Pirellulaceae bacterium]|nr:pyridoxal phosphate-dependent aminotransferase [Pirellulaceae bacterium]
MPQLSTRAVRLPPSPIRKLAGYAEAAKKRGVKVYHLNIGQPDVETPPEFFQAIKQADLRVLAYSPSAGFPGLLTEIANYYDRLGYPLESSDIIVTTGASEALTFAFAAILNAGDEVIVPEPYYANYSSFSLAKDATVVPVTTRIEDGFALPDMSAFEERITPRTKAILICNPGNPTGVLYPRESLEELRKICLKHDLFLIADEVYREFAYDGHQHHSTLELDGMADHVIVVDSISKRFSACGARIGCVISRNRELMGAIMKMAQARLSPPTLGQIGAEAVYKMPPDYYHGVVCEYASRRDVLVEELSKIDGVVCPPINGAFYAMVRLPVEDSDQFCQWLLEDFEHEGATVMLAPGSGFYATPGLGRDEVRIAYVLNADDLRAAVRCLGAALQQANSLKLNATR